jgi:hypothetical protein
MTSIELASSGRLDVTEPEVSSLREKRWRYLPLIILAFATVVGGYIRLYPVLRASFPLGDGGLFHLMIGELQTNNYQIPAFTSYNNAAIPFAYPPLSFYLSGWLSELTGISGLDILRLGPAFISSLTIPAFFMLGRSVLGSTLLGALASAAFAFSPSTFVSTISGGGITRAPGVLFVVLCLYVWSVWLQHKRLLYLLLTSLGFSLAALSHPTAPLYAGLAACRREGSPGGI